MANAVAKVRARDPGDYIPLHRIMGKDVPSSAQTSYPRFNHSLHYGVEKPAEENVLYAIFPPDNGGSLEAGLTAEQVLGTVEALDRGVFDAPTQLRSHAVETLVSVARRLVRKAQSRAVFARLFALAERAGDTLLDGAVRDVPDAEIYAVLKEVKNKPIASAVRAVRAIFGGTMDIKQKGARGISSFTLGGDFAGSLVAFFVPPVRGNDGWYVCVGCEGIDHLLWRYVSNEYFEAVNSLAAYTGDFADTFVGKIAGRAGGAVFGVASAIDTVGRVMASVFRAGATVLNPRFGLGTNVIRDLKTLYYNTRTIGTCSGNPLSLLRDWFRSLAACAIDAVSAGRLHVAGDVDRMRGVFDRLGMRMANSLHQDSSGYEIAVRKIKGGNWRVKAHSLWEFFIGILQFPEQAARLTEMQRVAEQIGWSPAMPLTPAIAVQLVTAGKAVTTDFTQAGRVARAWNRYVPFFNSAIQGKVSAVEAFRRNPVRWVVTRGLVVAVIAALNWWRNKDEEWYREESETERLMYDMVRVGDEVVRIPRAFEVDILFAGLTEAMLDGLYHSAPERVREWFAGFFSEISVVGDMQTGLNYDALPPLVREVVQQAQNRDAFWRRAIVPSAQQDLSPQEQVSPYTSQLAVWLAAAAAKVGLGDTWIASPRRIDHAIQGLAAGTGSNAAGAFGRSGSIVQREQEPADFLLGFGSAFFRRGGVNPNARRAGDELARVLREQFDAADAAGAAGAAPEIVSSARRDAYVLSDAWRAFVYLGLLASQEPSRDVRGVIVGEQVRVARDALAAHKDGRLGDVAASVRSARSAAFGRLSPEQQSSVREAERKRRIRRRELTE
jgi:hypothetical protein